MRTLIAAGRLCKTKKLVLSCFLILASAVLWAQEKTVTGVVKNAEDGSPLAKASVHVKGTNIITATDDKGAFSIKAKNGQVLVVSVVGYRAMEKTVGNATVINFDMESAAAEMENVVVTALGIRREEKALGYSVS